MPAATLGMWLFLSSEAMFFTGLLGALIVLGSGKQHALFVKSAHMLNLGLTCFIAITLVLSSAALLKISKSPRSVAVALAVMFVLLQAFQWKLLLDAHTIAAEKDGRQVVLNGPVESDHAGLAIEANVIPLRDGFDIHAMTKSDFPDQRGDWMKVPPSTDIRQDINYGPSRNNFFASYFVLTGAHVAHLIAGLIAMLFYMIFRKGKLPDSLQIYWHFVNVTGIVTLLALYFV